ncbi:MAG: ral secretion pathway protein [Gammaproteobacteria bacterium]|jgi:general secretion pathway protein B|nr:ral secretion pathway protein [Gammaproteobacteria bacterium]
MSFILDALKKSETERQRQSVPGLMDTRVANRRNRLPIWAVLLGVLLVINVIVLAVVLMRSNSAPRTAGGPAPATAGADHFSPMDPNPANPVYAPEIPVAAAPAQTPVDNAAPITPPRPAAVPRLVDDLKVPSLRSARRADPVLTDEDAKADSDEVLPTINELSLSGSQSLPELHLDVHVYGSKPSERFVFINMRKYHEGTTLQEGPTVEHIRRDGVILNFHGLRFLLPRQS